MTYSYTSKNVGLAFSKFTALFALIMAALFLEGCFMKTRTCITNQDCIPISSSIDPTAPMDMYCDKDGICKEVDDDQIANPDPTAGGPDGDPGQVDPRTICWDPLDTDDVYGQEYCRDNPNLCVQCEDIFFECNASNNPEERRCLPVVCREDECNRQGVGYTCVNSAQCLCSDTKCRSDTFQRPELKCSAPNGTCGCDETFCNTGTLCTSRGCFCYDSECQSNFGATWECNGGDSGSIGEGVGGQCFQTNVCQPSQCAPGFKCRNTNTVRGDCVCDATTCPGTDPTGNNNNVCLSESNCGLPAPFCVDARDCGGVNSGYKCVGPYERQCECDTTTCNGNEQCRPFDADNGDERPNLNFGIRDDEICAAPVDRCDDELTCQISTSGYTCVSENAYDGCVCSEGACQSLDRECREPVDSEAPPAGIPVEGPNICERPRCDSDQHCGGPNSGYLCKDSYVEDGCVCDNTVCYDGCREYEPDRGDELPNFLADGETMICEAPLPDLCDNEIDCQLSDLGYECVDPLDLSLGCQCQTDACQALGNECRPPVDPEVPPAGVPVEGDDICERPRCDAAVHCGGDDSGYICSGDYVEEGCECNDTACDGQRVCRPLNGGETLPGFLDEGDDICADPLCTQNDCGGEGSGYQCENPLESTLCECIEEDCEERGDFQCRGALGDDDPESPDFDLVDNRICATPLAVCDDEVTCNAPGSGYECKPEGLDDGCVCNPNTCTGTRECRSREPSDTPPNVPGISPEDEICGDLLCDPVEHCGGLNSGYVCSGPYVSNGCECGDGTACDGGRVCRPLDGDETLPDFLDDGDDICADPLILCTQNDCGGEGSGYQCEDPLTSELCECTDDVCSGTRECRPPIADIGEQLPDYVVGEDICGTIVTCDNDNNGCGYPDSGYRCDDPFEPPQLPEEFDQPGNCICDSDTCVDGEIVCYTRENENHEVCGVPPPTILCDNDDTCLANQNSGYECLNEFTSTVCECNDESCNGDRQCRTLVGGEDPDPDFLDIGTPFNEIFCAPRLCEDIEDCGGANSGYTCAGDFPEDGCVCNTTQCNDGVRSCRLYEPDRGDDRPDFLADGEITICEEPLPELCDPVVHCDGVDSGYDCFGELADQGCKCNESLCNNADRLCRPFDAGSGDERPGFLAPSENLICAEHLPDACVPEDDCSALPGYTCVSDLLEDGCKCDEDSCPELSLECRVYDPDRGEALPPFLGSGQNEICVEPFVPCDNETNCQLSTSGYECVDPLDLSFGCRCQTDACLNLGNECRPPVAPDEEFPTVPPVVGDNICERPRCDPDQHCGGENSGYLCKDTYEEDGCECNNAVCDVGCREYEPDRGDELPDFLADGEITICEAPLPELCDPVVHCDGAGSGYECFGELADQGCKCNEDLCNSEDRLCRPVDTGNEERPGFLAPSENLICAEHLPDACVPEDDCSSLPGYTCVSDLLEDGCKCDEPSCESLLLECRDYDSDRGETRPPFLGSGQDEICVAPFVPCDNENNCQLSTSGYECVDPLDLSFGCKCEDTACQALGNECRDRGSDPLPTDPPVGEDQQICADIVPDACVPSVDCAGEGPGYTCVDLSDVTQGCKCDTDVCEGDLNLVCRDTVGDESPPYNSADFCGEPICDSSTHCDSGYECVDDYLSSGCECTEDVCFGERECRSPIGDEQLPDNVEPGTDYCGPPILCDNANGGCGYPESGYICVDPLAPPGDLGEEGNCICDSETCPGTETNAECYTENEGDNHQVCGVPPPLCDNNTTCGADQESGYGCVNSETSPYCECKQDSCDDEDRLCRLYDPDIDDERPDFLADNDNMICAPHRNDLCDRVEHCGGANSGYDCVDDLLENGCRCAREFCDDVPDGRSCRAFDASYPGDERPDYLAIGETDICAEPLPPTCNDVEDCGLGETGNRCETTQEPGNLNCVCDEETCPEVTSIENPMCMLDEDGERRCLENPAFNPQPPHRCGEGLFPIPGSDLCGDCMAQYGCAFCDYQQCTACDQNSDQQMQPNFPSGINNCVPSGNCGANNCCLPGWGIPHDAPTPHTTEDCAPVAYPNPECDVNDPDADAQCEELGFACDNGFCRCSTSLCIAEAADQGDLGFACRIDEGPVATCGCEPDACAELYPGEIPGYCDAFGRCQDPSGPFDPTDPNCPDDIGFTDIPGEPEGSCRYECQASANCAYCILVGNENLCLACEPDEYFNSGSRTCGPTFVPEETCPLGWGVPSDVPTDMENPDVRECREVDYPVLECTPANEVEDCDSENTGFGCVGNTCQCDNRFCNEDTIDDGFGYSCRDSDLSFCRCNDDPEDGAACRTDEGFACQEDGKCQCDYQACEVELGRQCVGTNQNQPGECVDPDQPFIAGDPNCERGLTTQPGGAECQYNCGAVLGPENLFCVFDPVATVEACDPATGFRLKIGRDEDGNPTRTCVDPSFCDDDCCELAEGIPAGLNFDSVNLGACRDVRYPCDTTADCSEGLTCGSDPDGIFDRNICSCVDGSQECELNGVLPGFECNGNYLCECAENACDNFDSEFSCLAVDPVPNRPGDGKECTCDFTKCNGDCINGECVDSDARFVAGDETCPRGQARLNGECINCPSNIPFCVYDNTGSPTPEACDPSTNQVLQVDSSTNSAICVDSSFCDGNCCPSSQGIPADIEGRFDIGKCRDVTFRCEIGGDQCGDSGLECLSNFEGYTEFDVCGCNNAGACGAIDGFTCGTDDPFFCGCNADGSTACENSNSEFECVADGDSEECTCSDIEGSNCRSQGKRCILGECVEEGRPFIPVEDGCQPGRYTVFGSNETCTGVCADCPFCIGSQNGPEVQCLACDPKSGDALLITPEGSGLCVPRDTNCAGGNCCPSDHGIPPGFAAEVGNCTPLKYPCENPSNDCPFGFGECIPDDDSDLFEVCGCNQECENEIGFTCVDVDEGFQQCNCTEGTAPGLCNREEGYECIPDLGCSCTNESNSACSLAGKVCILGECVDEGLPFVPVEEGCASGEYTIFGATTPCQGRCSDFGYKFCISDDRGVIQELACDPTTDQRLVLSGDLAQCQPESFCADAQCCEKDFGIPPGLAPISDNCTLVKFPCSNPSGDCPPGFGRCAPDADSNFNICECTENSGEDDCDTIPGFTCRAIEDTPGDFQQCSCTEGDEAPCDWSQGYECLPDGGGCGCSNDPESKCAGLGKSCIDEQCVDPSEIEFYAGDTDCPRGRTTIPGSAPNACDYDCTFGGQREENVFCVFNDQGAAQPTACPPGYRLKLESEFDSRTCIPSDLCQNGECCDDMEGVPIELRIPGVDPLSVCTDVKYQCDPTANECFDGETGLTCQDNGSGVNECRCDDSTCEDTSTGFGCFADKPYECLCDGDTGDPNCSSKWGMQCEGNECVCDQAKCEGDTADQPETYLCSFNECLPDDTPPPEFDPTTGQDQLCIDQGLNATTLTGFEPGTCNFDCGVMLFGCQNCAINDANVPRCQACPEGQYMEIENGNTLCHEARPTGEYCDPGWGIPRNDPVAQSSCMYAPNHKSNS